VKKSKKNIIFILLFITMAFVFFALINIQEILKLPDVLNIQLDEEAENLIWNELEIALSEAINNFINMRKKEGLKIQEDLEERIYIIEQNVN